MRRNSCTVIVLAGPVPAEVLGTVGRSMNVTLVRPPEPAEPAEPAGAAGAAGAAGSAVVAEPHGTSQPGDDGLAAAAGALRRAARATSPYSLVTADPLAAVADGWGAMWDLSRPQGPARFEQEAARALAAWRAGRFELPDYYLIAATATGPGQPGVGPVRGSGPVRGRAPAGPPEPDEPGPGFHLGPLRAARPHRVVFVPAAEPAEQAAGVLQALGRLRHGPWWPGLDELLDTARTFYPGRLAGPAATPGP